MKKFAAILSIVVGAAAIAAGILLLCRKCCRAHEYYEAQIPID